MAYKILTSSALVAYQILMYTSFMKVDLILLYEWQPKANWRSIGVNIWKKNPYNIAGDGDIWIYAANFYENCYFPNNLLLYLEKRERERDRESEREKEREWESSAIWYIGQ